MSQCETSSRLSRVNKALGQNRQQQVLELLKNTTDKPTIKQIAKLLKLESHQARKAAMYLRKAGKVKRQKLGDRKGFGWYV